MPFCWAIILLPTVFVSVHTGIKPLVPLLVEPILIAGYSTTTPSVAPVAMSTGLMNIPLAVGTVVVKRPAVTSER